MSQGMSTKGRDPLLDDLTEPQREAVTHGEGPLLVVAGAGSGKTRVITRRIAYLARAGVPPDRMLAITFTNKAADEMRRRVESLVGTRVTVSTFHSFCAWLLRRESAALGLDRRFSIYDRLDSARLMRQIIRDMNLDRETYKPAELLDRISAHKDRLEGPEEAARKAVGFFEQGVAEVYLRYNQRLAESNALDFDDLLLKTIELFSSCPQVLQRYQELYLHVLVDEYQDTNLPQHLIARGLQGKHRNITAVGDPDQMIYTWRGARLENILEFEEDFPGARIIKLERNYRSTANILRAASASIGHNTLRHEKTLWTDSEPGEPVRVLEFDDAYEEAEWVAQKVQELMEAGAPPGELAILYRTKYQSVTLEEALAARAIPYQVVDTVGFFERKEVKDLRAYVQLLLNPSDDAAFLRIVNVPRRGIGDKTQALLREAARRSRLPLLMAARQAEVLEQLGPRARKALEGFLRLYDRLAGLRSDSVYSFLTQLLEAIRYVEGVSAEAREDTREVLDYFLQYARQYDRRRPGGDLVGFMEQTALVSDVDGWNPDAQAVPLMTLHSAKGLEFDVVFIVGVSEGLLPHQRALEENPHGDEMYALEEERRLFHVGMTRARKELYLTYAATRLVRGREETASASRFLAELPREGVERISMRGEPDSALEFARQVQDVARRKGTALPPQGGGGVLELLDGPAQGGICSGARVRHLSYGEGIVVSVDAAGRHSLVRVQFPEHGVLTLLLPAR